MPKNQTAEVIELLRFQKQIARLIRPHLFHKVRLGYAVWHLLAIAKFAQQWNELAEREKWPAGRFKIKWTMQWIEPAVDLL